MTDNERDENNEECGRLLLKYPDLVEDWTKENYEHLAFDLIRINPEMAREIRDQMQLRFGC